MTVVDVKSVLKKMMIDIKHYIEVYKKHEQEQASTNERNEYWRRWQEQQKRVPKSAARFEHG